MNKKGTKGKKQNIKEGILSAMIQFALTVKTKTAAR
jgi:hypothetical protein